MNTHSSTAVGRLARCAALVVFGLGIGAEWTREPAMAASSRFLPDDPLAREVDPNDASRVQPFDVRLSWDLISSLFARSGDRTVRTANNINTIDEVPDSSWFTNRAGSGELTAADVARGPDVTTGPGAGLWTIVSGKSEGVRPGFTIVDTAGVRWFLKFDAPGYPEQATGAEVVATKLFWALGYNVAETHVATLRRETLVMGPDATISVNGRRRRLTASDIGRVLAHADRDRDGSYRVLASKALEGKPLGGFLYYGTRADDPNDVVPHENRRELRGMRLFAAWIDRVDAKAGNTLDTLVQQDGRAVVRHHVLDFGSTLGSGGTEPNEYWEGYQYLYEGSTLAKRFGTLGLPLDSWRTIHYPRLRGIGRFEADHFVPEAWKSRVPNAAYVRADAGDTFWAARKLAAITDGMIAAAVESGRYSDPAAARYLAQTLSKRRDAIERAYFTKVNPLVDPALDGDGVLTFRNAALDTDLVRAPTSYRASWYVFDNATGEPSRTLGRTDRGEPTLPSPSPLPKEAGSFVRVDVSAVSAAHPDWSAPALVYFRREANEWRLVGLERPITAAAPRGVVSASAVAATEPH